ncbi:MAG: hypothetical protein AAGI01_13360 [Myxococcota bacterium]
MKRPEIAVLGPGKGTDEYVASGLKEQGYPVRARILGAGGAREWASTLAGCAGCVWVLGDGALGEVAEEVIRARSVLQGAKSAGVHRVVFVGSALALGEGRGPASWHVPGTSASVRVEAAYAVEAEVYRALAGGQDAVVVCGLDAVSEGYMGLGWEVFRALAGVGRIDGDRHVMVSGHEDVAKVAVRALERGRAGRRYVVGGARRRAQEVIESMGEGAGAAGALKLAWRVGVGGGVRGLVEQMWRALEPVDDDWVKQELGVRYGAWGASVR